MRILGFLAPARDDSDGRLTRFDPVLVALWISLVVVAAIWLLPFFFIIITALKSNAAVMGTAPFAFPESPDLANFPNAWVRGARPRAAGMIRVQLRL